ncbi:MAG: SPOR domain-containing protein [Crocinitomicaceae bacterium]
MKLLFSTLMIFATGFLFSQDKSLAFPSNDTLSISDSLPKLDFNGNENGKVKFSHNRELHEITEFVGKNKSNLENVRISGFRVQIYFNENKSVALGQKANFISQYNEHEAYLDYLAPNYRVRVGNFRTKLEAEKLKQELLRNYPTCIIIKDNIELPALKKPVKETTN